MSEIGHGYAHGMFTGGVLGLTGGFMGSKFERVKKAQSRYPNTFKSLAGEKKIEGALRFLGKSGRWSTDPIGAATLTAITQGQRVYDEEKTDFIPMSREKRNVASQIPYPKIYRDED